MRPPITFRTPSIINDTPQERARVKRDLAEILRQGEQYLGPQEIDQLVRNHKMARRGNTADEPLNVLLLAEWDAAVAKGPVTRTEFAKGFYKRYRQQSVRAVEKRLTRLLEARERKVEQERKLRAALQRPSLLNEGTE
jgi:hypothetical protein